VGETIPYRPSYDEGDMEDNLHYWKGETILDVGKKRGMEKPNPRWRHQLRTGTYCTYVSAAGRIPWGQVSQLSQ